MWEDVYKKCKDIQNNLDKEIEEKRIELKDEKEKFHELYDLLYKDAVKNFNDLIKNLDGDLKINLDEMFKLAKRNNDGYFMGWLLDILDKEFKIDDVLDIYHRLIIEDWHTYYDDIIWQLEFCRNPSSVKYLYEAIYLDIDLYYYSPSTRNNLIHALWNFETEEAKNITKLLEESVLFMVRQRSTHLKYTDEISYKENAYQEPLLIEMNDICSRKNITAEEHYFDCEESEMNKFYIFAPYKKFSENLKSPKLTIDDCATVDYKEKILKFLENRKVLVSIFDIEEMYEFNGGDILEVLDELNYTTAFIMDENMSFHIAITKNKDIILQGEAMKILTE